MEDAVGDDVFHRHCRGVDARRPRHTAHPCMEARTDEPPSFASRRVPSVAAFDNDLSETVSNARHVGELLTSMIVDRELLQHMRDSDRRMSYFYIMSTDGLHVDPNCVHAYIHVLREIDRECYSFIIDHTDAHVIVHVAASVCSAPDRCTALFTEWRQTHEIIRRETVDTKRMTLFVQRRVRPPS